MKAAVNHQTASLKRRKAIVLAGLSAIILAVIVFAVIPTVLAFEADTTDKLITTYKEYVERIKSEVDEGLFKSVADVFIPGRSGSLATAANAIREGRSSIGVNIHYAVRGLGSALVVIFASIALCKELERGETSVEIWAKYAILMLAGIVLINNSFLLRVGLDNTGQWLVEKVNAKVTDTPLGGVGTWIESVFQWDDTVKFHNLPFMETSGAIWDWEAHIGEWFADLGLFIWTIIKMIGLTIILIVFEIPLIQARIVMLTIYIEIAVRSAFFPLAVADITGQGLRSPGMSYIKRYFGCYIQGGCCLIIAAICNLIVNRLMAGFGSNGVIESIFELILIFIVYKSAPKLFGQTKGIANRIVGE